MKTILRLAVPFAVFPAFALAVYAPIPEQEQGKALTFRVGASSYYDSNIFGSSANEVDSMVYNFTGAISYNGSLDDQTFASASYELSNDYQADRPGRKNLDSHTLSARLAHSFSEASNFDISGLYNIAKNPQSLAPLTNKPLNTDQSFKRGQLDARFTTAAGQKTGVVMKYRFIDYSYDTAVLATELDRSESLAGLELSYAMLPETKLVGEYRYQTINYRSGPANKDKKSNFLMAGLDYNPGKEVLVSARLGFENRKREAAGDATAPYAEFSSRYTYAEGSFLAVGYTYTIDEPSDTVNYTDTDVNRFFINLQHRLSGTITASGSVTYEPSKLQGRGGVHVDINETTTRFGLGLSWLPTKNWTIAATYDLDNISSDDPNRTQNRTRLGVSARYTF